MSAFFAFIVPLLLVSTSVKQCFAYNVGYVTMPLFEMLVKNLPQNELDTADEYTNLTEYYNKLRILDAWKANPFLSLEIILRDKATTVITDGRTLYERDALKTETLPGYNCTRWCYNVSVPQILNVTGWSVDRLDGKISPVVRLEDIHNAVVKAIEKRFCCNMTAIAIELNIDNGVKLCAPYIDVWEKFVPHVNNATIKCKADELSVTTAELAELLRTTLPSLLSYDLHQLDSNFFPLYEDLLNRKNLFETRSIITGVLANAPQWQRETMSSFASIVSQFTVRDLEILYRWRSPQLFAIQNIPMSIYLSGCNTVSPTDSLFKLSETLFGFPDKLPPCDIAFLLARSLNEVNTKFTVASIDNQNVLEIFRTESKKYSWFDFYQLLQLKIDDGIWIETPRLSQVAAFSSVSVSGIKENSIPQVVSFIQNFNNSGILNAIMASNYASFLTTLLNTYGYSAQGLAQAAAITQTQLNSLTIQRAHSYILTSIIARYDIGDLVSAVGISGVDFYVLTNLPSFEWDRIVSAAIQAAFNQSADAYSVKLNGGGAQVTTVNGGFSSIQVSDSATYHTNRISPSKLADCLNKTLSSIYAMTFTEYHQLFSSSILPLFQNKLTFETQSMESLLVAKGLQFADIEGKSVAEVITQLTGLTTANIGCFYPWSSAFISTDLAKTFANANTTRLCNDFLGLSLHNIVVKISETADTVCFLCPVLKPCFNNAVCTDIPNSFICTCNQGYTGDGIKNCDDILQCQLNLHSCHVNATCRDTSGTYQCTCNSGFLGNGTVCVDTDECNLDPNRCGAKGMCVNTIGGYYCRCETGYQWNGTTCVDINECTTNKHNCHAAAVCTNTIGSFSCACNSGLTGDGVHCEDILECNFQAGLYPCHAKAKCTEVFGSYRCECNAGYTGDGKDCDDINECDTDTDDCDTNALCFNTQPGFVCQCKTGFTGNGTSCSDILECDAGLDNCHKDANCINTVGSFTCDCKDGFNGNGTYCYVAQVSFVKNAHVVTEGGNVDVTISLSGAIDSPVVVSIALGGTATETVDYTTSSAAVLFQVNGPTTKTVTITTKNDTKLEATETITLTLSSQSNHVVPGGIITTIVTIADNDAVTVTLSTSTYNVDEGNGFAPVVVQINSGTVEREIIVSVTTVSSGSATSNVDYTPHTEEIRFSPGNVGPKLVRIPITNDNLTESNEQFTVVLSTTDNDVNLLTKTATVVIQDNDVATVKFEKSSYPTVGEGDGGVTVKVILSGSLAISVTARLTATNAGAVRDKDYELPGNLDVTFVPNGPTTTSITFTILQDTIVENDENFLVTLSSQSSPSLIVVTPTTTAITIIDDDVLSVSFVPKIYPTQEQNTDVKVNVVVTGTFEKSLVLSISTVDNTAKAGADYVSLVATPLIFNVGDPKEKEISVQISEDVHIEGTESFYVQMSSSDAKITFPNGTQAQINIVDDDVATAFIPAASYIFQEGATSSNISVILTGSLAIPVTVSLSTVHDTARWPSDFTAISNFEIEFTPSGLKTKTLMLDIKNDDVVEGTERFYVDLTTTSSYVSIGTYNRTSVLIQDNDELHVRFSSTHYTADENLRYAQVGLVLDKVLETSAMVTLTPFNGTATTPEDFPLIIYNITIYPGQPRTVYYKINITDDMLEEYSEHFFVSLKAPLSNNVKIAQPDVANITIAESDDIDFCDPNARRYPCHIKADCVDVPGSFVCTCITGYQGNGLNCQNTNECNTIVCPFNATCQDTEGSYKCVCQPGYVGDGVDCNDINECADKTDDCHANATCTNTLGSFDCQCNNGYREDGKVCTDINECQRLLDDCHVNATCVNIAGSFQCTCLQGFRGNGVQCDDINECNEQSDNCHDKATCANTEGSFTCTCKTGYSGDGITCSDINECTSSTHDCHVNASCTDMPPGSFSCACLSGFEGNGRNCTDINECDRNTDNCPTNSLCRNTIGSFFCECNPGFTHNGSVCKDDDECMGSNNCHSDAYCVNEPGSFRCVCKKGFTGDGTLCTNLDECMLNPGPCHKYANCTDTHGSFECNCTSGFTGNGTYCEDMIDCIFEPRKYPCDVRALCTDVPGGFTCKCPSGFSLNADKRNCDDVDECQSASTFTCHVNASCINTDGSYNCKCNNKFVGDGKKTCVDTTCSTGNPCSPDALCSVNVTSNSFNCVCNNGFTGDGKTCNDINECNIPEKCGANTTCVDQPRASYTCTCKPGFTGDPYQICTDIDECSNSSCHASWAKCINYPGGHTCVCNPGFTGDGVNCEDIDECKDPSTCDSNADCKDEDGNYTCTCRKGYTGDGKTCTNIDECLNNPCHAWAKCNDYAGGYTCVCNRGYTGNGTNCEDINECQSNPCEIGANCVNKPGSYQCVCPENLYRNGNFCHVFCPFKLDLAFIVDTSQSIAEADFLKVKNFMTESVAKMEIGEDGNHIAAIAFGNIAEVFMDFNTISGQDLSRAAVINKLSNFTQLGGLTRIDLALLMAERNIFTQANGMRTSDQIRKVAVVITDGEQTTGPGVPVEPLNDIAGRLQAKDITVLAIGVGANVPRHQMLNITNSIEENILEVNSFDNLLSVIFQFINVSCTDIDECKRYNPCHVNANCKDTLGAYSCLCKIGYTGNGFQCQDVDECASGNSNSCDQNAKCNNTVGSYTCTCNSGYSGNGRQCQDIDECTIGTHNCHSNARCFNEQGSFRCVCKSGFSGNGSSCTNINECITTKPCHQHASCEDNDGSYSCKCNGGYSGDGKQCTDIDECANDDHNCDSNANCTNVEGSFKCVCRPGYNGDGVTCTDAGCDLNCSSKAVCNKGTGGYKCVCTNGFSGNGMTCSDVDECASVNSNSCNQNAKCDNIDGSYNCTCNSGYNGNGRHCQDIDECTTGTHNCHSNANCTNNQGGFDCVCKSGFTGNGTSCTDIDECTTGTHNCHSNANCINNQGGFDCVCKSGFTGNGTSCTDIPCDPDCGSKAVCALDSMGGNKCVCRDGYTGNGTICTDINECTPNNPCHENANCTNTDGSFTCACKTGYTGDGKQCQDVDECASSNSNSCDQNAKCDNTVGSYTCTCNSGYTGNGRQCQDINECTTGTHNCPSNANCNNNQGSFDCVCKSGFSGDGITCTDINECTSGTHNCPSNANCNNNQGSFNCVCKSGFSGDGITCTATNVVNKCLALTSPCGVDQSCKSYDNGSYECFCTSPGRFLHNGVCIDVSTVSAVIKVISELFTAALSNPNSVDYYILSNALVTEIDKFFNAIYDTTYIGSTITNLSNGSLVVNCLLVFKPNSAPSVSALSTQFWNHLKTVNGKKILGPYTIEDQQSSTTNAFKDYNECNPHFSEHVEDCPVFSYCVDKYGSYSCECLSGYEKDPDHDMCVTEDDGWWIIYAVVFASILFVVLCLICLFCFLEFTRSSKELYTLHDELGNESRMKHDKRIDEEVAPGFPGSVPRTSSTGSQLLLSADRKSHPDSERLAMYEVNPVYDSANG